MAKIKIYIILSFLFWDCTSDCSYNLGNGYVYRDEGGWIKEIHHEYPDINKGIPPTVVSYASNTQFIIAKQICPLIKEINNSKEDYINYWIVNKKQHAVYGPLDSVQFQHMIKELGITLKLQH